MGGEFVLATPASGSPPRHHNGEGGAVAAQDRRQDGGGDLLLVGTEGTAEDVAGEPGGEAAAVGDRRRVGRGGVGNEFGGHG